MSHSRNPSMDANGRASTGRILREKNFNDDGGVSVPDGKPFGASAKGTMSRKNNRKSRANLRAAAAAQATPGPNQGLKRTTEPANGGDLMMDSGYLSAGGEDKMKDPGYLCDKVSVQRKSSSVKSPLVSVFGVAQPSEYMRESQTLVGSYGSDRFRSSSGSTDANAVHPTIDLNDMAAVKSVYPGLEVEIKKHIEDATWKEQKDEEERENWAGYKKVHPSSLNFGEQRKHFLELQYKFKDFPLVPEMEFEAKLAEIRKESRKQLYHFLPADEAAKATKAAEEGRFPDTTAEREEWIHKIARAFLFSTTVAPVHEGITDPEPKLVKQTLVEMDLNPDQLAKDELDARDRILNLFRDGPRAHLILQNGARKMMTLADEFQESGGIQIVENPSTLTAFPSWKARMDEMIRLCGESKTYALTFISATDIDRAVLTPGTSAEFYKKEMAAEFEHRKEMQLLRDREDAERALQVETLVRKARLASMEANLNSILSRFRAQEATFWSQEHEDAASPGNAFFDPVVKESFGADFNSIMYGTGVAKQVGEVKPKMVLRDLPLKGRTAQGTLGVIHAEGGAEEEW